MEKVSIGTIQLGKQGISDNFITSLKNQFKNHRNIKVSVLPSARPNGKGDVKKHADEILSKMGKNYTARSIGFVINIKKWRKNVRE